MIPPNIHELVRAVEAAERTGNLLELEMAASDLRTAIIDEFELQREAREHPEEKEP